MVSTDNTMDYPRFILPFTVHTYNSDKYLGSVISQNSKTMFFFKIRLRKPQRKYTKTDK